MTATDTQVRIAMKHRMMGKTQEQAGARADLSRKTVGKYERLGKLPSGLKKPRTYRTRPDPFEEDWPLARQMLKAAPTLEATALFEWLREERPGKYRDGQLRTFQRRVERWKCQCCEKMLSLPQVREPGRMMQVDGTSLAELKITVQGQPFGPLLIHDVLPYSNWEWGVLAQSESLVALAAGIQAAVETLGAVPVEVQTDNSTAATHDPGSASESNEEQKGGNEREDRTTAGGREFNEAYRGFVESLGMTPVTTHLYSPDENGDAEGLHGALKRALDQDLLLRGSRDFESVAAVQEYVQAIMRRRNKRRQSCLEEDLANMTPLSSHSPPPVREYRVRVSKAGTARVLKHPYSLPSGLKGKQVKAIVSEWEVEFWHSGRCVRRTARLVGKGSTSIDYRHVVTSLLRKPGGFRNYRYLDAMFPRPVFREAWEAFEGWTSRRKADLSYLRVLHLAATTLEQDVASVLREMLDRGTRFTDEDVKALVKPPSARQIPLVERAPVDLHVYDGFLMGAA